MTNFYMAARATVVVALAATVAGCGWNRGDTPPEVEFAEAGSAAIESDEVPDAVVTVRIGNYSDSAVTITGVEPVAERGLAASYLGWSTCKRGCAAGGRWGNADTRNIAVRGIEGKLPVTLPADSVHISFVFRLRVTHPQTESRFRAGCWLRVRHVQLTLDNGHVFNASTPDTNIAGIHPSFTETAPRPTPPSDCVTFAPFTEQ